MRSTPRYNGGIGKPLNGLISITLEDGKGKLRCREADGDVVSGKSGSEPRHDQKLAAGEEVRINFTLINSLY